MKFLKKVTKQLQKLDLTMTLMWVALLLVLYFIYTTFQLDEAFESTVAELPSKLKDNEKQLVLFYADWCGHCKKMKPDWDAAAKEVGAEKMIKVNVGDGTPEQVKTMTDYGVKGFPTILVFENGSSTGPFNSRDKAGFLDFFT